MQKIIILALNNLYPRNVYILELTSSCDENGEDEEKDGHAKSGIKQRGSLIILQIKLELKVPKLTYSWQRKIKIHEQL